MEAGKEVWIFTEHTGAGLKDIAIELTSEGRKLADKLRGILCAVLVGPAHDSLLQTLGSYSVDKVYSIPQHTTGSSSSETWTYRIAELIEQYRPHIMIFGATALGDDLGPRVAAKTEASFTGNCNLLDIDGSGNLLATKPIYRGKLYSTYRHKGDALKIATLNPGVVGVVEAKDTRMPEVISWNPEYDAGESKTRVVDYIKGDPRTMDLTEAEIIVSGGKGFGDQEGFQLVHKLAHALGASVGGTRMVTDLGWMEVNRQVGQTGKVVSPKLYLACGISGATQHIMGIKDSNFVVAINTDKEAPIFKIADLKIVGDVHRVLPSFIEKLISAANA